MSLEIRDTISPGLARSAKKIADRRPVLEAMGLELVSVTKRAFVDESLRPAPWPARKSGGDHSLLRLSGALWQSIRIAKVTNSEVTVASDRKYAAIHQMGGVIYAKGKALVFSIAGKKIFAKKVTIPARPFFPFTKEGEMIPAAKQRIEAVAKAKIAGLLKS